MRGRGLESGSGGGDGKEKGWDVIGLEVGDKGVGKGRSGMEDRYVIIGLRYNVFLLV